MAWFLGALFGAGVVASASAFAFVSPSSLIDNVSSSEAVKSVIINDQFPSSPVISDVKITESINMRDQKLEAVKPLVTPKSKTLTRTLSEVERYKERIDNPELCRLILSSSQDKSEVQVCRLSKDDFDIEFVYHTGTLGEMPILVKDLRYTYNQLVVNLVKPDNFGFSQKRLDLSHDIITSKGLISPYEVGDKTFTNKQCKLKLIESSDTQESEWKIFCRIESK